MQIRKQVKPKNMAKGNTKKSTRTSNQKMQIGSTKFLQIASFCKKELPP